ncbi:WcaI family glycosyltransferase [Mucilaginibacter sp.]|uniref:WcaI family glycosyltransferase n=1 Tax=Mucilaginibacter sp. TaxID=1882438 RepID=UPI003B001189
MKIKRVLVQGINFFPERTGMGKYTAGMVDYMVQQGIACTVVTSYPFHPEWKVKPPYKNGSYQKETAHNGLLTIYRCPMYVPPNPTGVTRIIQETSFILSSSLILTKLIFQKKFDAFIIISPPFHLALVALAYRFFRKTKIVYHIQDLQIDLANELKLIKSKRVVNLMFKIEKYILRKVDYVSTISEGMIKKIKQKRNIEVINFPNWVNTKQFFPMEDRASLKSKWNFSESDFLVMYSGNLGEKQGLEMILDVAIKFEQLKEVKFIICGNGAYKIRLIEQANKLKINNVNFISLQSEEVFNSFLNIADVHLIIQKKNVADLVMPSKLTTILAIGGQVIATASPQTTLYNVITNNRLGKVIEPDDVQQLCEAITGFLQNPKVYAVTARTYALQHLSVEVIMEKFLKDVRL